MILPFLMGAIILALAYTDLGKITRFAPTVSDWCQVVNLLHRHLYQ